MNIGTTIRQEFWTGRGARDTDPARSSSRPNDDGPFVQILLHGRRADAAHPLSNPGDHAPPTRRDESAADAPAAEPPETRPTSPAESDAASNSARESRSDSKAADDKGNVDKDRNAGETDNPTAASADTQPDTDHATQTLPSETARTEPGTDAGEQNKTGSVDLAPASGGHGPDAATDGTATPSQPAAAPSGSAGTVANAIPPNTDQLKTANLQSPRQPDGSAAATPDATTDRVASKRAKSHAKKRSNNLTMQLDAAMAKERSTPDAPPPTSRSVIDPPAPHTTPGTGVQTHGGGPDNLTTAPAQATGQQAMNATSSGGREALSEPLFARHTARTEGPPSVGQADQVRLVQRVARALRVAPRHGGTLRLRLRPPELGALRLEVTMDKGHLSARVEADNTNARHLLLEALPQLRDRLAQQGIRIEQFHVDVGHPGTGQTPDHPHDRLPRPTALSPPDRPAAAAHGPDSRTQTVTPIVLSPGELNVII